MASKAAVLDHLRQVSLFQTCTTKDLQRIAKVVDEVKLEAGRVLTDQGQTGTEAYVLLEGSATVRRNGKKVTTLGPGAVIGELSLLDRGPRTATVTTDSPCTVLVIRQQNFTGILDEVPALAHKMLATLAGRIRDLDRQTYG
jgi:CRP/FNR family cyclic AMP-dependent transcriptional regulator